MKTEKILFSICILFSISLSAQRNFNLVGKPNKGKFYVYWGWNRGYYTKSDIHFKGTNYDFQLNDVKSTDKQSPFSVETYLDPRYLTVPQFNARLGYNLDEHYSISIGDDHMKYLMTQNQEVNISGEIAVSNYPKYNQSYDQAKIKLAEDFLMLQHCDGLNYLNIDLRRYSEHVLYQRKGKEIISMNLYAGFGIGALMPRTRATLLTNEPNHMFHFAGFGCNGLASVSLEFFGRFFIQSELKGGFINMPDIMITMDENDYASQNFWFAQRNIVFGYIFSKK